MHVKTVLAVRQAIHFTTRVRTSTTAKYALLASGRLGAVKHQENWYIFMHWQSVPMRVAV